MTKPTATLKTGILLFISSLTLGLAGGAQAQLNLGSLTDKAKGAAESGAKGKIEKEVNAKLTAEAKKNQCSFKTDSDQLAPGCDAKLKKLTDALVDAKKRLDAASIKNYKFEVSGHTDSSGKADHNKELSGKRAAVIVKELVSRGIAQKEIISLGLGSERPLVTPDDTPAKKAKNRRYEIQVRL
jgi:outer membrane protein OmpA-like peptidoglycan-associated protein